jgi:integrase
MPIRKREWQSKGETKTAWVVDYVDQSGKRRLKTFSLKKEADSWATTARHEIVSGTHALNAKITVEESVAAWVKHSIEDGLERGTCEQRARHLKLHIAPFIGSIKLADLTTASVNTYMDVLRDSGRSVAMRRKVLTSLSSALAFALGRSWVSVNAAHGVRVRSDERHRANGALKAGRDFPTKAELKLLMDHAPERWRPYIVTAIFTGMRASELRGLRWSDVDLENAVLHVAQRADAWGSIGSPKSVAGKREIPLTRMVVNALKQHPRVSDLVFTSRRGSVVMQNNFHAAVWQPLLRACGLDYTFHSLRRAAASLFIELGWAPKRIQAVMGHSSITMIFDRYGHLFPQGDVSEDMRRLEAAVVAA